MANDGKKNMYFVKKASEEFENIRLALSALSALKDEYIAHSPSPNLDVKVFGSVDDSDKYIAMNKARTDINTAFTNNQAIIDEIKTISGDHPNFKPASMGDWG